MIPSVVVAGGSGSSLHLVRSLTERCPSLSIGMKFSDGPS